MAVQEGIEPVSLANQASVEPLNYGTIKYINIAMLKRFLRRIIKNEIDKAYRSGYADGCVSGYRRCEDKTVELISICKREAERGTRLKMLSEMLDREDKAYTAGLKDAGLINK